MRKRQIISESSEIKETEEVLQFGCRDLTHGRHYHSLSEKCKN